MKRLTTNVWVPLALLRAVGREPLLVTFIILLSAFVLKNVLLSNPIYASDEFGYYINPTSFMATKAITAMPSVERSKAKASHRTFRPKPTGVGKTAFRPSSTASAMPSSACSAASRTSAESPPDTTASLKTSSPPSNSLLSYATGYESEA